MSAELFFMALLGGFSGFGAVMSVISFRNAYSKAKSAGIVKIFKRWGICFNIFFAAAMVVASVTHLSDASKELKKAEDYELLKNSAGFADYIKDTVAERDGIEISDPQKYISNYIERLNNSAKVKRAWGILLIFTSVCMLIYILDHLLIFTVDGIIYSRLKEIEPITAERRAGKIYISFKAKLANSSTILTVNATPKNLSVFARYFEDDTEQAIEGDL